MKKSKTYNVDFSSLGEGVSWDIWSQILAQFAGLDVSPRDGAVTVDEFEAAVPQPDTQEVFDSADTDRDAFIGWQEFLHAMTSGM